MLLAGTIHQTVHVPDREIIKAAIEILNRHQGSTPGAVEASKALEILKVQLSKKID